MERKTFEAEIKRFTGEGRGAAVLARLGVRDKDGDVLLPGLLGGVQQAPLIQSHQWQLPPIGRAAVREQGGEMVADFALNLETAGGREWASVLKFDLERGPLQQWSWGFSIPPGGAESGMHEGQPVRFLKRVQLHEVSPVVVGASIGSRTLALKEGVLDQAALAVRVQETLSKGEKLMAKLAFQEFERITDREREARERPHGYVYLPKGADPRIEQAAARFAGWATEDTRMTTPEVRLFREAREGEAADFSMPYKIIGVHFHDGSVAVDASLGPELLAETTAHEIAHSNGADEREADAFARKFMTGTYRERIGRAAQRPPVMTWDQGVAVAQYLRYQGIH